ncbi:MAG TPA: GDP-mannose 4,6-dehydratase [Anaerolineales bacterium]|nr:GDP-mannose 4,6-dehydratase [Anaerolineales bacterium]
MDSSFSPSAPKRALITGITGQDGSFLAELLLEKGYEVHGIVRRVALEDPMHRLWRIQHLLDRVRLHAGSMESYASLFRVVEQVRPDECYHLAAQSFVDYSFDDEFSTIAINVNGTHYLLSALKQEAPDCHFYFAGSSEMFGKADESPQSERTDFHPRSPYGISKVAGFQLTRNYREAYGMFAVSGIAFNHESERRGFEFVTRKITSTAARIKYGLASELRLGNLQARRDWGYAPDYVEGMWRILQIQEPQDLVLATGETHSVQEFVREAFRHVDLDPEEFLVVDDKLYRPAEVHQLRGDASRAEEILGWKARVTFSALVRRMVEADLRRLEAQGVPTAALATSDHAEKVDRR